MRYHYDASGRVVGRTLDPSGANLSQFFIYDEDRIVQELDGDGDLVAEWVYGDYIDEIFAMYRDTDANGSLESTYYYIQDDLYNVVALTDEDGEVVERYSYDDYGMPTVWVEDGENPGTWIEHTDASGAPCVQLPRQCVLSTRIQYPMRMKPAASSLYRITRITRLTFISICPIIIKVWVYVRTSYAAVAQSCMPGLAGSSKDGHRYHSGRTAIAGVICMHASEMFAAYCNAPTRS